MGERDYLTEPLDLDALKTKYEEHYKAVVTTRLLDAVCNAIEDVETPFPDNQDIYEAAVENGFSADQKILSRITRGLTYLGCIGTWNDVDSTSPRYIKDTYDEDRVNKIRGQL